MVEPVAMDISNWHTWHQEYEDATSELAQRARLVQRSVLQAVESRSPSSVSVISICGGQGRELIGALEDHASRGRISGHLIELDPDNARYAQAWARRAALEQLHVLNADASMSETYQDLDRADLVILSGVFGHLDAEDVRRTVAFLREICVTGTTVVWTSYEVKPERTASIGAAFGENEFQRVGFDLTPGQTFGVVVEHYRGLPRRLEPDRKIFTFGSSRAPRPATEPT